MIYILHYLRDRKPWELWVYSLMGNAGFISSTVVLGCDRSGWNGSICFWTQRLFMVGLGLNMSQLSRKKYGGFMVICAGTASVLQSSPSRSSGGSYMNFNRARAVRNSTPKS